VAEFSLSAFGLTEPPGAEWPDKSLPLWVWAAVAGVGCLVLGAGLRIVKKRWATKTQSA